MIFLFVNDEFWNPGKSSLLMNLVFTNITLSILDRPLFSQEGSFVALILENYIFEMYLWLYSKFSFIYSVLLVNKTLIPNN